MTRRRVVAGAAALGLGAGLDRLLVRGGEADEREGAAVPFHGAHQAGIATPAQEFVNFATFDLHSPAASDLRDLLVAWTRAASVLAAGETYGPRSNDAEEPPADPGEALGLGPSRLTLTFGFGPSIFDAGGRDRFGLDTRRPQGLRSLPVFRGDDIDPARSGGDLCVQACSDNAQAAFHAIHVLTRLANGTATLRWGQAGFGRTSSTSRSQSTPRNLMGFKDGTENIRVEDREDMDRFVWVGPGDDQVWMSGGSYLIARRIQILFDVWDATSLEGQERTIGRQKSSGAPLGGRDEYDPVDLGAKHDGEPTIPADAHIRLASPRYNGGERILRRGYSYSEPPESSSGQIDAGLFFICFQRDPIRQFIPIQRRLAASDGLNRHTLHTASAIFACPPGVRPGCFIGEGLFA